MSKGSKAKRQEKKVSNTRKIWKKSAAYTDDTTDPAKKPAGNGYKVRLWEREHGNSS